MRRFPPRLPEQPIFYPVLSEEYAVKIARDWNAPASGKGFVTRFLVSTAFLERYEVRDAGREPGTGLLDPRWRTYRRLNDALIGEIEVVAEFSRTSCRFSNDPDCRL